MMIETIVALCFGLTFVIAMLALAVKFPRPTAFQYTVFRIVLAIAVAGVAAVIPGFLEVSVSTAVKAGGALGVFIVVYFFSPASLVTNKVDEIDLPTLTNAWEGIRAPDINDLDLDMAHKALNALNLVAWYWNEASKDEKRLIKDECFSPYKQWFSVLDSKNIDMSDGKSSRIHLDGRIRDTYKEMKNYE